MSAITDATAPTPGAPADALLLQLDMARVLYEYAATIDRQDHEGWIGWFTPDGSYTMTTYENARGKGLMLIVDRGTAALGERAAGAAGYLNVRRTKTLHVVGNVRVVDVRGDEVDVASYLTLFKTAKDGTVRLQATGECRDVVVRTPEGWRFRARHVVLDAETLPGDLTDLL